jgi:hypothetical protein
MMPDVPAESFTTLLNHPSATALGIILHALSLINIAVFVVHRCYPQFLEDLCNNN